MAKIKRFVQEKFIPSRNNSALGLEVRVVEIYKIAFAGRITKLVTMSQRTNTNNIRSEFFIAVFLAFLVFHKQKRDNELAMKPKTEIGIIMNA